MTFKVGQKVVCIHDFSFATTWALDFPSEGAVYTIRAFDNRGDGLGLLLEEIKNRDIEHKNGIVAEPCWCADRFRPLIERKTSTETGMQILTDILKRETVEDRPRVPQTER